jgi:hypothetical protein
MREAAMGGLGFEISLRNKVSKTLSLKNNWVSKDQKSYVLPHMRTLDQGQTQQGDWTMST